MSRVILKAWIINGQKVIDVPIRETKIFFPPRAETI